MKHLLLTTTALTLCLGAARAQETEVRLLAATAMRPDGTAEVRLRWPISQGWLPEGGFRLYRTGPDGQRAQLFPAPLPTVKLTKFTLKLDRIQALSLKGSDLGLSLQRASARARSVDAAPLFDPPGVRAPSSAALFGIQAKAVRARALASPFASLKARSADQDDDPPEILAYRKRIEQRALRARSAARAPGPDDSVRESRQDLLLSALTRPQVATELGIAATDTGKPGETVVYELFAVDTDGKEGKPLAELKFAIGDNPAPEPLDKLQAEQIGDGRVALRWERPKREEESRLGVVTYKLTRVDAKSPTGKPLTDTPFFLAEIDAEGGALEPIGFFNDEEASVGAATYRVSVMDMFGRESKPAEVTLNVEDMRPAAPAKLAQAALQGSSVRVVWQKSATPGARYRIWRRDAEVEGSAFSPLTPAPIDGLTPDPASAVRTLAGRGLGDMLVKGGTLAPTIGRPTIGGRPTANTLILKGGGTALPLGLPPVVKTIVKDLPVSPVVTTVKDLPIPPVPPVKPGTTQPGLVPPALQIRPGELPVDIELLLGYEDKTAQSDHKYVYAVTAQLPGSRAESAASETRVVPYPAGPTAPPTLAAPVFKAGVTRLVPLRTFQAVTMARQRAARPVNLADRAELSWTAPSGQSGLRYRVYRGVGTAVGADDWELCSETTETRFADPLPAARAVTYAYKVVAVNRWDAPSEPGKALFDAPPTIPPDRPEIVNVATEARGGLAIKIRAAAPDESVARYRVERKEIRPLVIQTAPPVFLKALRSREAGLTARGEDVVDANGEPLSVPEREGGMTARGGLTVQPLDLPEASAGYKTVALTASAPDASGLISLVDPQAASERFYYYRVIAETTNGLRSETSEPRGAQAIAAKLVPAPAGLTTSAISGGVALRWSAVLGASRYLLLRTGGAGPRLIPVATGQTTATDTGLRPGVSYQYALRAVSPAGKPSAPATTTFTAPR